MIDKDEYPQTAEIEARCVNILADLWNSPEHVQATGCSTTGSSEAAMLGGHGAQVALAGADARRPASRPTGPTWSWAPTSRCAGRSSAATGRSSRGSCRWRATASTSPPTAAVAACDENTIGVVAILGSTFDGSYEPVKEIAEALDKLERTRAATSPLHVDAASGGFVAPFLLARARVGLPPGPGAVDQRLGPQVRPRLPGGRLGDLARRGGAAAGPRVRRQLPRRPHADVRAELLAARQRGDRAVLHVHEPRARGLPPVCRGRSTSPRTSRRGSPRSARTG